MKMSRSYPLPLFIEKLDRNDHLWVGWVFVRFVELCSLNRGLLNTGILPWIS